MIHFLKRRWRALVIFLVVSAGLLYWFSWHLKPFTQNAFVFADTRPVSALTEGFITEIHVKNNQFVRKGEPLFTVFREPYRLKTAELENEAEDVSISLITGGVPRTVKVNGAVKIQLKPTDKTQRVWSAEVEIKSIGIKKAMNRHGVFMKMDVLGGELDEPVWVGLPFKVHP